MDIKACRKLSYGMYVVSSKNEEKFNGQIANAVFQVSSEPPTVAVSINKENLTHEYISASKVFVVSVLSVDTPMLFIGKFGFRSGRDSDKFKDTNMKVGITGTPIVLDYTLAFLEFELISSLDCDTHTLFLGKLVDSGIISDAEPLTYDYYHKVIKGKSPKSAPTYIQEV